MTHAFIEDFSTRKRHVRHYALTVALAEREAPRHADRKKEARLLTLRAGLFLVLYNAIEASTRASIEAIHDHVTTDQIGFEDIAECIRREVIRRFKNKADPKTHHSLTNFPSAFVAVALDQTVDLSGNVDARTIRGLGETYGFSCDIKNANARDGADLLTIKDRRNELGHGRKTYEEIGRDYPAGDLLQMSRRAMTFMDEILDNVATYIDNKGFLVPGKR